MRHPRVERHARRRRGQVQGQVLLPMMPRVVFFGRNERRRHQRDASKDHLVRKGHSPRLASIDWRMAVANSIMVKWSQPIAHYNRNGPFDNRVRGFFDWLNTGCAVDHSRFEGETAKTSPKYEAPPFNEYSSDRYDL